MKLAEKIKNIAVEAGRNDHKDLHVKLIDLINSHAKEGHLWLNLRAPLTDKYRDSAVQAVAETLKLEGFMVWRLDDTSMSMRISWENVGEEGDV